MEKTDPTPAPERPVPPIFADDETLERMMGDATLVLSVAALLARSVQSKHDLVRLFAVMAAMVDIGNVRQFNTGFGNDGFAELASNAWLKVDELRAMSQEVFEKQRRRVEKVSQNVDANLAAIIEKQLGLDNDKAKD